MLHIKITITNYTSGYVTITKVWLHLVMGGMQPWHGFEVESSMSDPAAQDEALQHLPSSSETRKLTLAGAREIF